MAEVNGNSEISMEPPETTKKSLKDLSKENLLALLKKSKMRSDDLNRKYQALEKKYDKDMTSLTGLLKVNDVETVEELGLKIEQLGLKLEHVSAEKETIVAEKASLGEKCQAREDEVSELKASSKAIAVEKESFARKVQHAEEEAQCMKMKLDTLTETCKFLQDEVSRLNSMNSDLKKEVDILSEARDTALQALKNIKEDRAVPDGEEMKNLQSHCDELESKLASFVKADECAQTLRERNGELEKQNEELMEKCETFSTEKENLYKCVKDMDAEMDVLKNELEKLCSYKKNYLELKTCADALDKNSATLKKECDVLGCEKVKLIQEKEALEEKAQFLSGTVALNEKKISELQELKTTLEGVLDDSCKKINDLIKSNSKLEEASGTNEKLCHELSEARQKIEDLEKNIFNLVNSINEATENNGELEVKIKAMSSDLEQCNIEKNLLLSEVEAAVRGMLSCQEEEREGDSHHYIQLLKYTSIEFNEMKIQLDSLRTEKTDDNEEANTAGLSREDVKTQTSEDSKTKLKTLADERESLLKENEELKTTRAALENSVSDERSRSSDLDVKYSACLAEIESLKLQLDEYESDIQKHQNLEQENLKILECVKELEKDNYELSEFLDSKCTEINEANLQLESLVASILNHTEEKELNSAYQKENNIFDNIFTLKSLCREIISQKDRSVELLKKIEMDVMDMSRCKQNLSSEIDQLKSLNQFLEDEIRELREEAELNSKAVARITSREIACQVDREEMVENVSQTHMERVETCDASAQVELLDNKDKPRFSHSASLPGEISEWGYVAADDAFAINSTQNDAAENLVKENEDLKSLLEKKSNLVEQIHCQVDSLLSKVEELTEELENKDSELNALNRDKKCKADEIVDLQERIRNMIRVIENISAQLTSLKQSKCDVLKFVGDMNSVQEETICVVRDALADINAASLNYHSSLMPLKVENDNLKAEIGEISELLCELSKEVRTQLERLPPGLNKMIDTDGMKNAVQPDSPTVMLKKLLSDFGNLQAALKVPNDSLNQKKEEQVQASSEKEQCFPAKQEAGSGESKCIGCENLPKEIAELTNKLNKFKAIAIKMKKELSSTTNLKDNFEKELKVKSEEMNSAVDLHAKLVNNFQNIQSEYDKLQDEFESIKADHKSLQNQLLEKGNELSERVKISQELESTCSKLQKQMESLECDKAAAESKCMDAESKTIILQMKTTELQEKILQLTADLSKAKMENSDAVHEKERFRMELESALKEGNKHSLLDLEMADYERTISDLTAQLEKRTEEVKELKKDVEDQISKIFSLQEEIKFSESSRHTEEMRAESFKQALENSKKELAVVREKESELREEVAKLNTKIETLGLIEQDCKATISTQSAELEQLKEILKSTGESHRRIVQNLNSKITAQKQEIVMANKEVESVKQNFENYKTRVHNVLKQQKTVTPFTASDAELKEKLEAQNEKLKLQVKDLSEKLQALTLESESFHDEHEHLLQRHEAVIEELEAKGRQWNLRLEQFNMEKAKLEAQLEDKTSQCTLQVEMLASMYKKQIKLLQEEHKRALEELHKQLESADVEISRLQREHQSNGNVNLASTMNEDSLTFDILSQERQEGEGSEFTDGTMTPVKHFSLATIPTGGFLPLEKLLQSPAESEAGISVTSNQDSDKLSADLNAAGKKIDHLSELLNESEANNLHMSDQVRVLKDELRRLERNKQREAHAENLEYLKNVFVKFATLQPGSEKSTLVPVLNTILKLSPEEHQQLKDAAGGEDVADTSSRGWGSYLHRWSGVM